jgi:hypothetical protein
MVSTPSAPKPQIPPAIANFRESYAKLRLEPKTDQTLEWRGDLGGFTVSEACPDGILHNIGLCGIHAERLSLIEAIERWLR